jgi:hypothetical protein
MPNLSQRYVAALAQLSQFRCVAGGDATLTHVLTGVQVAPESTDEDAEDASLLHLTFPGGHKIEVIASMYLELQLAEHAAHEMHSVNEGTGEIHKRAEETWGHLSRKHDLE